MFNKIKSLFQLKNSKEYADVRTITFNLIIDQRIFHLWKGPLQLERIFFITTLIAQGGVVRPVFQKSDLPRAELNHFNPLIHANSDLINNSVWFQLFGNRPSLTPSVSLQTFNTCDDRADILTMRRRKNTKFWYDRTVFFPPCCGHWSRFPVSDTRAVAVTMDFRNRWQPPLLQISAQKTGNPWLSSSRCSPKGMRALATRETANFSNCKRN